MSYRTTLRFVPLAALVVWQAVSGVGLGQVREASAWIEGMT